MECTQSAYFLAKVYHEAYVRSESEYITHPIGDWDSLSKDAKTVLAGAMQTLLDLHVIQPISLNGVRVLRNQRWESVKRPDRW